MSSVEEVETTVSFLNKSDAEFALLHCNSTYPAPFQDINLKWIKSLKKIHSLVGYSGHERGTSVSLAALTIGACIIERHFTLDRTWKGTDHAASLEPQGLQKLVRDLNATYKALQFKTEDILPIEQVQREKLKNKK